MTKVPTSRCIVKVSNQQKSILKAIVVFMHFIFLKWKDLKWLNVKVYE